MITSHQILQATGLKSQKTLTRWAHAGIIPEPLIGTHPAGRGKIAYWPDWVLERCKQIVELQRQGHTLSSALATLEHERMLRNIEKVKTAPDVGKVLAEKKVALAGGREVDLGSLLAAFVAKEAEGVVADAALRSKLAAELRKAGVAAEGLRFAAAGYCPVCFFDGRQVEVVPDFLVGHKLSEERPPASAWVVIPLLPALRKAFSALGRDLPARPSVRPAPKVWAHEGGAIIEYGIFLGGGLGFELIRETAKTIGTVPEEPERSDDR
jgi:hypothetical protein